MLVLRNRVKISIEWQKKVLGVKNVNSLRNIFTFLLENSHIYINIQELP